LTKDDWFRDYYSGEADSLTTHILVKIAKNGSDTPSAKVEIQRFINDLPEYQKLSIAQWISSYAPDNKVWYPEIFAWVLESLVTEFEKNTNKILKTSGRKTRTKSKNQIDYQRAKQELKCVDLALEYGVILKGNTSSGLMIGSCPFHSDRTPSFTIYPENNFYCFGCHKGGDSITLLKLLKQN